MTQPWNVAVRWRSHSGFFFFVNNFHTIRFLFIRNWLSAFLASSSFLLGPQKTTEGSIRCPGCWGLAREPQRQPWSSVPLFWVVEGMKLPGKPTFHWVLQTLWALQTQTCRCMQVRGRKRVRTLDKMTWSPERLIDLPRVTDQVRWPRLDSSSQGPLHTDP